MPDATLAFPLLSGLVALAGAPLWIGMVPPNRFYGVRTPGDEALWYAVNRATGRDIVFVGGLALALSLGLADLGAAYAPLMSAVLAAGAALVLLVGIARLRRI
jgi:hypothetical protein